MSDQPSPLEPAHTLYGSDLVPLQRRDTGAPERKRERVLESLEMLALAVIFALAITAAVIALPWWAARLLLGK